MEEYDYYESTKIVFCQCCRYSGEVSTWIGSSGLIAGIITCEACIHHYIWNKLWHRISTWWWIRTHIKD